MDQTNKEKTGSFLGSIIGLGLVLAVPVIAAAATPVDYWTFNEGTGRSVNDSLGGMNGVMIGTSTGFGWAGGKVGVALAMDGADGTGVALPSKMLHGTQGSISVWIKLNSLSDRNIILGAKSTTDNSIYAALLIDRDGRPMIQYRDSSGADHRTQAAQLLNTNEWYHLVFSADSQRYHFYINGTEVNSAGDGNARWFSDLTNQDLGYRIGMLQSSILSGSFDGYIDDMRIYDQVLTQADVDTLHEEGNAAGPTLPVDAQPKLSMNASPDKVANGGSSVIAWSGKNVDTCTKSNAWSGSAGISGSETVSNIVPPMMYVLTCSGKDGSASATVMVSPVTAPSSSATSSVVENVPVQEIILANPMTEAERQAKIAEIKAQILELIKKLQALIVQMSQQAAH